MSTLAEPPPPPMLPEEVPQRPPLQRFLLVEADQFCPCGYNLHGQRVTFDERLDIPVVRCPECGKWHPAGHGSTAMRPWLARLATVLLAVWCLFNLGFTLAVLMTLFGVTMGRTVGDTVEVAQLPDGRQVTVVWDDTGKTSYRSVVDGEVIPQENLVIETRLVPSSHPMAKHSFYGWHNDWNSAQRRTLNAVAWFCGFLLGVFYAIALWHLRGLRRWMLLAVMLLPAAGVVCIISLEPQLATLLPYIWGPVGVMIGGAAFAMAVGLLIGRPLGRIAVIALVPPRPRQFLAFLWLADGKTPPRVTD